jgi:uroporphyrinogen decarboxylase
MQSNSREVIQDMLQGRVPARVPYVELIISEAVMHQLHPGATYFDFCEREGVDCIFIKRDFRNRWIDREQGLYTNEWGITRKKGKEGVDDYVAGPVQTREDVARLRMPDPLAEDGFTTLKDAVARHGKSKIICFHSKATFSHAWYLMGSLQDYLLEIYTEGNMVKDLNRIIEEYHLAQSKKAIELGADMIVLSDDYAYRDRMFISRQKFIEYCLPSIQRQADLAHSHGKPLFFHSDGNIGEVLDLLVEAGIDFLHPVEPGAMDMREVFKAHRDDFILCGNVDCAWTLPFGTPEQVRSEVRRLFDDFGGSGRYIISSSNTIHSSVNADNYRAMLDTIHELQGG